MQVSKSAAKATIALGLLSGSVAEARPGNDLLYGITSNSTVKEIYELKVDGEKPVVRQVGKNNQPYEANAMGLSPSSGQLFFTEAAANSRVARFDPTLHNPPTTNCITSPNLCVFPVGGGFATPPLNGTLAGRLGFRAKISGSPGADPRLFGVNQAGNRPLHIVNTSTGRGTLYGQPTVGGVAFNTGAGGDHTFSSFDLDCGGGTIIPAGSMFILQNAVNPALWVIAAGEFDDCDNAIECNLEVNTITNDILGFSAIASGQGLGFDFNDNPAYNGGVPRLWVSMSDNTMGAVNACTGALVANSIITTPTRVSDLTNVVDTTLTGFATSCQTTNAEGWAPLAAVAACLGLIRRRRKQA